jgi:hypothetical protein
MMCRPSPRRRWLRRLTLALAALFAVAPPLRAQQDPGVPREGFRLFLQPGLVFSRLTGDAADAADLGWRNRQALQVRVTYPLVSGLTAFVEAGSSTRGTRTRDDAGGTRPIEEIHLTWWDLGVGTNVALRCTGPVCPSLDLGGAVSRRRDAILRDGRTGRPVGAFPIEAYDYSALAGLRLRMPPLRNVTAVVRVMEGFTSLPRTGPEARSRSVWLQAAVPLNGR